MLFFVGAVAMRGAGCTYNDIVDADIDEQVERTRSRPLPSGQVTRRQAWVFLVLQALAGLAVLLQFNSFAIVLGIASLVVVAIYPFMKRFTNWPQLVLGLAFSWGALMGWAAEFAELARPGGAALSRLGPLGDRLRHDLRASGQGGRRALSACARPRGCSATARRSWLVGLYGGALHADGQRLCRGARRRCRRWPG